MPALRPDAGPVLITGCSSGIGKATAIRLAAAGWTVWATARREETLTDCAAAGCRTTTLDVTDEESMVTAVKLVETESGPVAALVNNAGYGQEGALETVPLDDIRRQFETNVFGLVRMCQLVLPGMREAGRGTIVNISSMGGRFTFPGGGAYHASKHAVEALSDALRFEVRPFGIEVVIIEPGIILTDFGSTAIDQLPEGGPYGRFHEKLAKQLQGAYGGVMGKAAGVGPDTVAKVVQKALDDASPATRYRITPGAKALIAVRRALPDKVWDRVLRVGYIRH